MDYAQRLAQAKELYSRPLKEDKLGQKFPRGCFVKVCDKMPSHMSHFESGFFGIVEYTYAQKYGGSDVGSYSLIVLDDEGKPVNSISWYEENQLTLVDNDIEAGKRIIEAYKFST